MAEGRQLSANKQSKEITSTLRRTGAMTDPGQPRTLSRTCHSHYGLQRGPSRPWLTRCCGCVCLPCAWHMPALVHSCTWPQSHGHCNPHTHTITHSYTVLSSRALQLPALSWAWCSWAHTHAHALAYTGRHSHPALHMHMCIRTLLWAHGSTY